MPYVEPVENSITTVPLSNGEQIKDKILSLKVSIEKGAPGYEQLLHIIHKNLQTDPDTVHLLTDEEIGIICAGLSKKTAIILSKSDAKKANSALKGTTLDDL